MPKSNTGARSITYASAINEATRQLMAEDNSVFLLENRLIFVEILYIFRKNIKF